MRWLAVSVALLASAAVAAPSERPHVYLVIVDGLDARRVVPTELGRLLDAVRAEPEKSSVFWDARAVMPARTNSNYASLLTGAYPQAHGITGNGYWNRDDEGPPADLATAELLEVESLFTVAESAAPGLRTVAVFAKPKLGRLFGGVAGRQRQPDVLRAGTSAPEPGYSSDAETMSTALAAMADTEPDLAVVAIADVDRIGHEIGPEAPEYGRAVTMADAAIGRLVDHLRATGRWRRSVLIVTADHGFTAVTTAPGRTRPRVDIGRTLEEAGIAGVRVVPDGGVAHVYADAVGREATAAGSAATTLARAAAVATATPGVGEVLARLPLPGVKLLGAAHPDWHLDHERVGDLLLVAALDHHFVDARDPAVNFRGDHGAPDNLAIPLVVTGGHAGLRAAPLGTPAPAAVDVGATIAVLLGLGTPKRVDGSPVPPALCGTAIAAVLAASAPHSPH